MKGFVKDLRPAVVKLEERDALRQALEDEHGKK